MSTHAQVIANRQNAEASTGPTTPEGKKKSSLNATRHGFTGQSLVLTDAEKSFYETHSISYLEQFQPTTHEETDLVQQYADLRWSLHQIAVQQSNVMSLINALSAQLIAAGDLTAIASDLAPHYKALHTLSTYEQRRRRAADATLARFNELTEARRAELAQAAKLYTACKSNNRPFVPSDFGFVHSIAEIEKHVSIFTRRSEAISAPPSQPESGI